MKHVIIVLNKFDRTPIPQGDEDVVNYIHSVVGPFPSRDEAIKWTVLHANNIYNYLVDELLDQPLDELKRITITKKYTKEEDGSLILNEDD